MTLPLSEALSCAGFPEPLNSPIFRLAAEMLAQMDTARAIFRWGGASIRWWRACTSIPARRRCWSALGREEDQIHCPRVFGSTNSRA
jgi:hypothetical protein